MTRGPQCEEGNSTLGRCVLDKGHGPDHIYQNEVRTEGPELTQAEQLANWWRTRAESEIGQTVEKAVEYGSDDLVEIGREMVACGVKFPFGPGTDDEKYAELGIFFYEVGKMARWRSAVRRGARPSDDTIKDFGIYIRMVQRVRDTGIWP